MRREAFSLIELMVSISILSIMMIFLYESYGSLNRSNAFYKKEVTKIIDKDTLKEIVYLDFSLALHKSIKILNQEKNEDVVFMQSSHSLHKNYNPYIAYIMKESKLYRLESLQKFNNYPLSSDAQFSVDDLGEVTGFRVYKSDRKIKNIIPEVYLVDIDFKETENILLKIKVLNEY
ncbi:MAG: prepilin-type N-terminal cleavage/methylation domain-containing protein [Campylobacterota bacterium]|nr:prepilin-type N-terminal cleavage/methylation domain-containing protein [Campylobacterota bacterium]